MALCALLAVFAILCLGIVMADLGVMPVSAAEPAYLLREYEGVIAIYSPADAPRPATVTDIRVADLPRGDRLELRSGIGVTDFGAVVRLLEDYGA